MSDHNGRFNILIVEDEIILALSLQDRLEQLGYNMLAVVDSCALAVQLTMQLQPDLVLMDIKLKDGGDGVEAARLIRQNSEIPIVFMTAYGDDLTLQRARETRAQGFLMKPFPNYQLSQMLTSVLPIKASR